MREIIKDDKIKLNVQNSDIQHIRNVQHENSAQKETEIDVDDYLISDMFEANNEP